MTVLTLVVISLSNCSRESQSEQSGSDFNPATLDPAMNPVKQLRGQLLYMPVYSNVPYQIDTIKFNMSAFIAIHNTDMTYPIKLTKVLYFDQGGKLVNDYLKKGNIKIDPLATRDYYVPYADQSGTGANFLVEWVADSLVNEPLIESVTTCLKPNNTVAILSKGKILKEKK